MEINMRRPLHASEFRSGLVAFLATCLFGSTALADEDQTRAHKAFETFAVSWMEIVQEHAKPNPGASGTKREAVTNSAQTYLQYDDDFTTEIRATGSEITPFVGVLRYRESLYQCKEPGSKRCTVVSSAPVTEIFRYQNESWIQ